MDLAICSAVGDLELWGQLGAMVEFSEDRFQFFLKLLRELVGIILFDFECLVDERR